MEIKIGKSARNCVACGHGFLHEQELKSLVRLENQTLQREDYCAQCWDPSRAAGAFSLWSARFYDRKVAEQEAPEVFSPLRQAFYESVEAKGRAEVAKAYLAAQLLRRQKVFRFIKEANDPDTEVRIALFSDRIGNALVEVYDPNLSYEEMEEGRRALLRRLDELENPQAAGGDAVVTEGTSEEETETSEENGDYVRTHEY